MREARAYYNEIDLYAAEWLRNLIAEGHIAPGDVDTRSIVDVQSSDLEGYTQCHFFAGIAGWSYAARLAGWPDERPVWTGSCPCQPFSQAGKGGGFTDERHLWPAWLHLMRECRPQLVFGEQVASKAGLEWLDLIQADLDQLPYASGAVVVPAAGIGAHHARHRTWWVAHPKRDEQPREEPRIWPPGRMGRQLEPVSWDEPWPCALSRFRTLGDGLPRSVGATDAARNSIVPQVAAEVIGAYLDTERLRLTGEAA